MNPTTNRTASGLKRAGSQKKPYRFATASFLGRHPSSSSDPIFSTTKTKGKVYSRKRKRDSVGAAEYVYPGIDFSPAPDGDDDQQAELRGKKRKKKKAERGQGGMRISSAAIAQDSSDETDESTSDVKATPPMPESEVDSVFAVVDKILHNQVDFLVKQAGLSENFRQVVTKIWFSYLTVALPDVSRGIESAILEDKAWLNSLRSADFCCLIGCQPRDVTDILATVKKNSQLAKDPGLGDKGLEENDDILMRSSSKGWRRPKTEFDDGGKSLIRRDTAAMVPERLTISRLLAFIVLALRLCDEPVLLSDILRWIRGLQFPLLDLNHKVPRELDSEELSKADQLFRKSELTSYHQINFHVATVVKLLDIKTAAFPQQNLSPLLERFVQELHLPRDFIPFVGEFLLDADLLERDLLDEKAGSHTYAKRRASNPEAVVMASIIYSLRLLFGLDGVAERKIHQEIPPLNESLVNVELFDFYEWTKYMQYLRLLLFRHSSLFPPASVPAEMSILSKNLQPSDQRIKIAYADHVKVRVAEAYGSVQASFQLLEIPALPCETDINLHLPLTMRPYCAHAHALTQHYPSLSKDFSTCSLSHVLSSKKDSVPKKWRFPNETKRDDASERLGRIRGAMAASAADSFPVRSHNIRGFMVEPNLEYVRSEPLKFLIRIAAEMIEQSPQSLLGEIMYLEILLYPDNEDCRIQGGKAARAIDKLRN